MSINKKLYEPSAKQGTPSLNKKQILVQEGLFIVPSSESESPHLIGSKCRNCGEVVFPKQDGCPYCCSENVGEVQLGPKGKLASFTNVNHPVPVGYKGPIPYGVGWIDLPEGVRIISHLTEYDPNKLKIDQDMSLVIDRLFIDENGNEIIGFKFKPI